MAFWTWIKMGSDTKRFGIVAIRYLLSPRSPSWTFRGLYRTISEEQKLWNNLWLGVSNQYIDWNTKYLSWNLRRKSNLVILWITFDIPIFGKKRDPLPDGSLLAVDRSLFSVVNSEIVQMYHHEHCKTGQIGVVAVLKHKPTGKRLIVATTHLAFNPYRGDWKLKQSIHLIAEITKQIELSGDSRNAFPEVQIF